MELTNVDNDIPNYTKQRIKSRKTKEPQTFPWCTFALPMKGNDKPNKPTTLIITYSLHLNEIKNL